jgi:hypothetical protein
MNREIFQWSIESVPAGWTQVRNQWEYSHAARFLLQLIGLCALQISILVETPIERSRDRLTPKVAHLTRH